MKKHKHQTGNCLFLFSEERLFMQGKSINEIAKEERITTKEVEHVLRMRIKELHDLHNKK